MSLKSLVQGVIFLLIIVVIGSVYFNYFLQDKLKIEKIEETPTKKVKKNENSTLEIVKKTTSNNIEISQDPVKETKIIDEVKKNVKQINEVKNKKSENTKILEDTNKKIDNVKSSGEVKNKETTLKKDIEEKEVKNLVKDIEYLTTDKNGNKYKILATSGGTNLKDNSILDLVNVRGIITSEDRSTIFVVSDFAEYNSSNQNSKFYQNVVITYENKEITCNNFDINMENNLAIAYNNVVITDPNSIMKAGKVTLDIITKNININPENKGNKVKVITN